MESKLGLNLELVEKARASAKRVAEETQNFIDQHTTVTVERAVCRLLGIDGVNEMDVPMPNVLVDHLLAVGMLPMGAAWTIGNAMLETGLDPQGVAEAIDRGELDLSKVPAHDDKAVREAVAPYVKATIEAVRSMKYNRVVVAFQPHTYTRTKALFDDFVRELRKVDLLVLAEIYAARERNTVGISSRDLQAQIPGSVYCQTLPQVTEYLREIAGPGDVILTVGAGDIFRAGEALLK